MTADASDKEVLLLLKTFYKCSVKYLLSAVLCVVIVGVLTAQPPGNWYLSKILNDNNGLPQNSVRSIYYDTATNFLWLATEAGIVRYNGQDARVFDLKEIPDLHSMRIINLFSTVSGGVMACNNIGELFAIERNYPQPAKDDYHHPLQHDFIYRTGNILNGTTLTIEGQALGQEPTTTYERSTVLWLNDSTWLVSTNNDICLVCRHQVVHRWPRKSGEVLHYLARGQWVYAINSSGRGWQLHIATKEAKPLVVQSKLLAAGKASFFYNTINNQPLLLQGNEVHELFFKKDTVCTRLLAILPDIPTYITALALDKWRRHLFVATNATGLYIYHLSPFTVYTFPGDDIMNNNYASVLADSNHIFTIRSLLFDINTGLARKLPIQISQLASLGLDAGGNIWSSTYDHINHFQVSRPAAVTKIPFVEGGVMQAAYQSKGGRFWVSTQRQLGYATGKSLMPLIAYPDLESALYFLTESPDGKLYGVSEKGVFCIDTVQKKLVAELQHPQLTHIRYLMIDTGYRCWIGTYGEGIFVYDLKTKKLTHLPMDDKGYLQYAHSFADDGQGNFMVPTNKGLFRLSRHNLLQIAANPSTPLYYQYFNISDGLLTNEFNGGCQPAYVRLPDGDMVLPAIHGLVRVKIKELPNPGQHPLFIDYIQTRNNVYKPADNLRFGKEERTQTWQISTSKWDHPNSQAVFYSVDGDTIWQRLPAGETGIVLNDLQGGSHVLDIRYQYSLQAGQFTAVTYRFYVNRFYYETVWFWLALLLLLAGAFYIAIRLRLRQLKQKNLQLQKVIRQNTQELSDKNGQLEETLVDLREALKGLRENSVFKDRLLGLIGHDMLLPLRFIARIANHLYDEAEVLSPEVTRENGNEIKNTVTELLYLGESLIQWIKLQEGRFRLIVKTIELRQLAEEIMQVHRPMAAVKNNQLQCVTPAGIFCRYDAVFLKVILHNLLLNANKFTAEGSITVNAWLANDELHCAVQDTGAGMTTAMTDSLNRGITIPSQLGTNKEAGWGMGYLLILDLLRFAGGRLHVESALSHGTTVQFTLPLTISDDGW